MNDLRTAAQMALEALEWSWGGEPLPCKEREAITALKAALAAPVQEPVAWRWSESGGARWFDWTTDWSHHERAKAMGCAIQYATPAQGVTHE